MSWQIYTAISVFALSISILLQRVLLFKDKTNPYAYAATFQGIVGLLLMVYVAFVGFKLPGISTLVGPAIIAVVFYGTGHIVYAKTLQKVEASAFSVLFATQTVWIMVAGLLLFHESLARLQVVGTVLIFAAVLLLVKNIRSLSADRGTALGLLTGLMFGIATVAWSYVGRHTDAMSWAAISFIGTAAVSLLTRPSAARHIPALLRGKLLGKMTLLAVFYVIGSVALLYAYREGTFSEVSPLRQTGIILTTLLALVFLARERTNIVRKLLAAAVSFVGVLLIII